MNDAERVVVTGMGAVSPNGVGRRAFRFSKICSVYCAALLFVSDFGKPAGIIASL